MRRESIAEFEMDMSVLEAGVSVDLTLGGVPPERWEVTATAHALFTASSSIGVLDETAGRPRAFASAKTITGAAGTQAVGASQTDEGSVDRIRIRQETANAGERVLIRVVCWYGR